VSGKAVVRWTAAAVRQRVVAASLGLLGARLLYRLLARGSLTIDVGIGRRLRQLGPVRFEIAAPREVVFDVIATPYLGRTPRALAHELEVWERGSDMALAAHFTDVRCGTATTVETVRFHRPDRIDFRLVRGPVPHVVESFVLEDAGRGTELTWQGELGSDFWAVGGWWGGRVARLWERAVRRSLAAVTVEAERRAA
jgi:Polyketide cyclase / dehydrase and lipid transport